VLLEVPGVLDVEVCPLDWVCESVVIPVCVSGASLCPRVDGEP
jgi:hypothetical protein